MVYLTFGEYEDGALGEIFLDVAKAGAALRAVMDAFARTFSIALQHGTPLEVLVEANSGIGFLPNGPVESEGSEVRVCQSIIDWAMEELRWAYLGGERISPRIEPGEPSTPSMIDPSTEDSSP